MVVFSLKLLNSIRKALAGRRYPHQLAGGVALGVLLGVIPHGNLLAVAVLLIVLSFRVNHAMMGLVAIMVTFGATHLDPYSHQLGDSLLAHSAVNSWAMKAWALPLIPWTDLNNTVVLGSLLIGIASVPPTFALTLPLFRLIAPAEEQEGGAEDQTESKHAEPNQAGAEQVPVHNGGQVDALCDPSKSASASPAQATVGAAKAGADTRPHAVPMAQQAQPENPPRFSTPTDEAPATLRFDRAPSDSVGRAGADGPAEKASPKQSGGTGAGDLPTNEQMVAVETRLDVIRMKDHQNLESKGPGNGDAEQPMDEALNYLLHQLRHSQQKKAAG